MGKKRIHDIAKELNVESKLVVERAQKLGISVKTASSSVDDLDAGLIMKTIRSEVEAKKAPAQSAVVIRRRAAAPEAAVGEPVIQAVTQRIEMGKGPAPAPAAAPVVRRSPDPAPAPPPETPSPAESVQPEETPAVPRDRAEPPPPAVRSVTQSAPRVVEMNRPAPRPAPVQAPERERKAPAIEMYKSDDTEGGPVIVSTMPPDERRKMEREGTASPRRSPNQAQILYRPTAEEQERFKQEHRDVVARYQPGGSARPDRFPPGSTPGDTRAPTSDDNRDGPGGRKRKEMSRADIYSGQKAGKTKKKKQQQQQGAGPRKSGGGFAPAEAVSHAPRVKTPIKINGAIVLGDLAHEMGLKVTELIKKLMEMGEMITANQRIDVGLAELIAGEFGWEVEDVSRTEEDILGESQEASKPENLRPRPPVVTIMGHVDHGKTTLLDTIRKANVAAGEAGGITQHIGAYTVKHNNQWITFLDTPGHEAFTAMRARGAQATDIVILVVAADDGIMPQTVEAINHAKAAGVPIIVAINKIDKPQADAERVKRMLTEHGLVAEEWGGDIICVEVSAKMNKNIDKLLEYVLLQAEVMDLKADPTRFARGVVLESSLDKGRGAVATILIKEGTLHKGDFVVCGTESGKVRALIDEHGGSIKDAGPSRPVKVLGLSGVVEAGDTLVGVSEKDQAEEIARYRTAKQRERELAISGRISLKDLYSQLSTENIPEVRVILKADTHGSVDAIAASLQKLTSEKGRIRVIHSGVGGITMGDAQLAAASNALILGFHVRPDAQAREIAEREGIDIELYNVIYHLIEDMQKALTGLLKPVTKEELLGRAQVRETFSIPKVGTIAGCMVIDGKVSRQAQVRVIRDNVQIYEGKVGSLRRFKDDVKEVVSGFECGIGIEGYNDVKVNDIIEFYNVVEVPAQA
ncbi:MAG: Elongation factor 4 [Myxococcota bacterium]|nr:Elongation factor 4 [Myxococcota bacterium]